MENKYRGAITEAEELCNVTEELYVKTYTMCEKDKNYIVDFSNGVSFAVSAEEFFEYSLYDSDFPVRMGFEELLHSIYSKRAFSDGVRFVLASRKSKEQIRKHLSEKGYSKECVESAVELLEEQDYIDDTSFAVKYIKKTIGSRIVSKRMLICELKMKGISEDTTEYCMQQLDIDDYMLAEKAVAKKRAAGINDITKLRRFLSGKGFSQDAVGSVLKEYYFE